MISWWWLIPVIWVSSIVGYVVAAMMFAAHEADSRSIRHDIPDELVKNVMHSPYDEGGQ